MHLAAGGFSFDGHKGLLRSVIGTVVRGDSGGDCVGLVDGYGNLFGCLCVCTGLRCRDSDVSLAVCRNRLDHQRTGGGVHADVILASGLDGIANRTIAVSRSGHFLIHVTVGGGHVRRGYRLGLLGADCHFRTAGVSGVVVRRHLVVDGLFSNFGLGRAGVEGIAALLGAVLHGCSRGGIGHVDSDAVRLSVNSHGHVLRADRHGLGVDGHSHVLCGLRIGSGLCCGDSDDRAACFRDGEVARGVHSHGVAGLDRIAECAVAGGAGLDFLARIAIGGGYIRRGDRLGLLGADCHFRAAGVCGVVVRRHLVVDGLFSNLGLRWAGSLIIDSLCCAVLHSIACRRFCHVHRDAVGLSVDSHGHVLRADRHGLGVDGHCHVLGGLGIGGGFRRRHGDDRSTRFNNGKVAGIVYGYGIPALDRVAQSSTARGGSSFDLYTRVAVGGVHVGCGNGLRRFCCICVSVGRRRGDRCVRARRHIPASSLITIVRLAADRRNLICRQLQRVPLVAHQGHGLVGCRRFAFSFIPRSIDHLEGHGLADAVFLRVGIGVGGRLCDRRFRARRRIPASRLVGIVRFVSHRRDLVRRQLQHVTLIAGQRHGLVGGRRFAFALIPGTVHHLEGHLVADGIFLCVGVGVRRIADDRGARAGRSVPCTGLVVGSGLVAHSRNLICSQVQRIALVTRQGHGLVLCCFIIPRAVHHLEGNGSADAILLRVGIGVSRRRGDLRLRAGRHIPASRLVGIVGLVANRRYLACRQLQHIAFVPGQGHDLVRCRGVAFALIPGTVDHLEGHGLADRRFRSKAVNERRRSRDGSISRVCVPCSARIAFGRLHADGHADWLRAALNGLSLVRRAVIRPRSVDHFVGYGISRNGREGISERCRSRDGRVSRVCVPRSTFIARSRFHAGRHACGLRAALNGLGLIRRAVIRPRSVDHFVGYGISRNGREGIGERRRSRDGRVSRVRVPCSACIARSRFHAGRHAGGLRATLHDLRLVRRGVIRPGAVDYSVSHGVGRNWNVLIRRLDRHGLRGHRKCRLCGSGVATGER